MSEFTIIGKVLNMYHAMHSARCALIEKQTHLEPRQRPKMERFGKIIIVLAFFANFK